MTLIRCANCHRPYPETGIPYRCPVCGGVFDFDAPLYNPEAVEPGQPGLWRYRHTFQLPENAPQIYLGEGRTPLLWGEAFGMRVAFKLEYLNPTGSYKDRGSAVLMSFLRSQQVIEAVEDSSGNAGASFAAYAARSGVKAHVYVPEYASGPKRKQIEAYGADIVSIPGNRSATSAAVLKAAEAGQVYASHAYLPQGLFGYATIAYELVEQLGQAPGAVISPTGQGNLLLAIGRGFAALKASGVIARLPALVGVQARACSPLWAVFHYGAAGLNWVTEGETLAEGIRIKHPLRGDALLQLVQASAGTFLAVDEDEILPGRDALAGLGLYVEPTSAIVWNALQQIAGEFAEPVVAVLTGSGFKSRD